MQITLWQSEVMEAITAHLKKKKVEFKIDDFDDVWIEFQEPVWREKKHKNGKTVMNEHGFPKREIEKYETVSHAFSEDAEFRIYTSFVDEDE